MLLSAITLVVIDGFYLKLIKQFFNKQIKSVQGTDIQLNLIAAAITYIFLIFGLNYFILQKNRSIKDAALLGLVIYGVYEFTNLSLLKEWSVITAIIDTAWGSALFAITTAITYKLRRIILFP